MPIIEYECKKCGYTFRQVAFSGEENQAIACRDCGEPDARPTKNAKRLFDGISGFSDLASDTN